ncbi:hypothetical protein [Pantoea piersonii]|uniref:hypothetical protein n=1 Tax=Pantoea piersonii TaxID=2364647 RepID=UPI0022F187DE|nr:hypothetical protein [Pantoea piersonii]WBV24311.1 hypothetical protein PG877_22520 [Pantoea piersonii]
MSKSKRLKTDSDRGMITRQVAFIEELLCKHGAKGETAGKKMISLRHNFDESVFSAVMDLIAVRNRVAHSSGFNLSEQEVEEFRTKSKEMQEFLISKLDVKDQHEFRKTTLVLAYKGSSGFKKVALGGAIVLVALVAIL